MDNLREKITQELYDFNVHADITIEDLADVMFDIMSETMKGISGREYVKRFGTCPMCIDCPDGCPLDNNAFIELPCKIDDTVYIISRGKIIPLTVDNICISKNVIEIRGRNEEHFGYGFMSLRGNSKGVDWFLTEDEAIKALEDTKGM